MIIDNGKIVGFHDWLDFEQKVAKKTIGNILDIDFVINVTHDVAETVVDLLVDHNYFIPKSTKPHVLSASEDIYLDIREGVIMYDMMTLYADDKDVEDDSVIITAEDLINTFG